MCIYTCRSSIRRLEVVASCLLDFEDDNDNSLTSVTLCQSLVSHSEVVFVSFLFIDLSFNINDGCLFSQDYIMVREGIITSLLFYKTSSAEHLR